MSYADVVEMVKDWDLRMRLVACAAQEFDGDPVQFVEEHAWRICGGVGWEKSWVQAREKNISPAIDDGMIRAGVRSVVDAAAKRALDAQRAADEAAAANQRREQDQQLALYRQQRELDTAAAGEPIAEPEPTPARRSRAKKEPS